MKETMMGKPEPEQELPERIDGDAQERCPDCDALLGPDDEPRCYGKKAVTPANPPDEALGAGEVARQIVEKIFGTADSNPIYAQCGRMLETLIQDFTTAIHVAEERVRREDTEHLRTEAREYATRAARLATDDSEAVQNFAHDYGVKAEALRNGADLLARLGGPKREK